jgi:hypothetical protein
MKIFISHAAEQRLIAEELDLALRAEGHDAWLGLTNLEASETHHREIRQRIAGCDLFIFLVSPHSIAAGRYTLTELELVRKRWPHPRSHVLPVLCVDTPMASVPPYVKAVTILQPQGHIPSAVAGRVAVLARARLRKRAVLGGAIALLMIAAIAFVATRGEPRAVRVQVERLERWRRGLPWEGDRFIATLNVRNGLSTQVQLSEVEVQSDSAAVVAEISHEVAGQGWIDLAPRQEARWGLVIIWRERSGPKLLAEAHLPRQFRWRPCWTEMLERHCTDWMQWSPAGEMKEERVRQLSVDLFHRARLVQTIGDQFLLALAEPPAVVRLHGADAIEMPEPIDGEARVLHVAGERIFVGTSGPDQVIELHPHNLQDLNIWPIAKIDQGKGNTARFTSSKPASIALAKNRLWVSTAGSTGESAVLVQAPDWRLLPYQAQLSEMLLLELGGSVLGYTEGSPMYLHLLKPSRQLTYSGHDIQDVGCLSALTVQNAKVIGLACGFEVLRFTLGDRGLVVQQRIPGPNRAPYDWKGDAIIAVDDELVVGLTRWTGKREPEMAGAEVHWRRGGIWSRLIEVPEQRVRALAANRTGALLIASDRTGKYGAWFLSPPPKN